MCKGGGDIESESSNVSVGGGREKEGCSGKGIATFLFILHESKGRGTVRSGGGAARRAGWGKGSDG